MRICVLHSSYDGSDSATAANDPIQSPKYLLPEHEVEEVGLKKATAERDLVELSKKGFDVFVNMCDGGWHEDRCGRSAAEFLELMEVPFTGTDARFYDTPSILTAGLRRDTVKEIQKRVALSCGFNAPACVVARDDDDVEIACKELHFPVLVKDPNGWSSIGMTEECRCKQPDDLRAIAKTKINDWGTMMIEEFIEGREFTVLVADNPANLNDPIALRPAEVVFPPNETWKHFQLKWIGHEEMGYKPVTEPELDRKLRQMAKEVYLGMRGVGYGRMDARANAAGEVYFLELNPNPSVFYPPGQFGSTDFVLAMQPEGGMDHKKFANHIIQCALVRHELRVKQRTSIVQYLPGAKAFHLFAARDLAVGECVEKKGEEREFYLVSHKHVQETWSEAQKLNFRKYAWPASPYESHIWSPNPLDWQPINHSCEPNCWYSGLNCVTLREVKKGEELTVDYAVFCVDCEPFPCECGSACCRGMVTGTDYLKPELIQKYGDHVSPGVQLARELHSLRQQLQTKTTKWDATVQLIVFLPDSKQTNSGLQAISPQNGLLAFSQCSTEGNCETRVELLYEDATALHAHLLGGLFNQLGSPSTTRVEVSGVLLQPMDCKERIFAAFGAKTPVSLFNRLQSSSATQIKWVEN